MEKGISRMKARFFRVRFSDNGKGIYHTLAYRDEIEKTCVHLSYLSEGGEEPSATSYPIDILVAADLGEDTLEKLETMTKSHSIGILYLPKTEEEIPVLRRIKDKVGEVHLLEEGKTISWKEGLWEFWLGNLGGCLSLYHGYAGTKELGEDCVYVGRIYGPEDFCSPCILENERDHCGFGCTHHRDFHLLKAHNDSRYVGFRTGTLLLGRSVFRGQLERLLGEISPMREQIRVIQLPHHIEAWDREILKLVPEEEIQYYVGHTEHEVSISGGIASHNGYCRYVPVNRTSGLCLSGYFIPFLREKNC